MPVKITPKNNKVVKALSPEELALISNCQTILNELASASTGNNTEEIQNSEETTEDTQVENQDGGLNEEETEEASTYEKEVKMILKTLEETSSEGPTAMDDAETRLDGATSEESQKNIEQVAKSLGMLALANITGMKPTVKKSVDPTIQSVHGLTKIVKAQQAEIGELTEAMKHIFKGIGLTEQLEVAKSKTVSEKISKQASIDQQSVNQTLAIMKGLQEMGVIGKSFGLPENALGQNQTPNKTTLTSQSGEVRKGLSERRVLSSLLDPSIKKRA